MNFHEIRLNEDSHVSLFPLRREYYRKSNYWYTTSEDQFSLTFQYCGWGIYIVEASILLLITQISLILRLNSSIMSKRLSRTTLSKPKALLRRFPAKYHTSQNLHNANCVSVHVPRKIVLFCVRLSKFTRWTRRSITTRYRKIKAPISYYFLSNLPPVRLFLYTMVHYLSINKYTVKAALNFLL